MARSARGSGKICFINEGGRESYKQRLNDKVDMLLAPFFLCKFLLYGKKKEKGNELEKQFVLNMNYKFART